MYHNFGGKIPSAIMTSNDNSSNEASPPPGETSISGTIEFRDVREAAHNVTVYVRVQDVGRVDASASTVAEQALQGVNIIPGAPPIPFTVDGIPQNPRARYVVRVHADVDGDGRVSRGDYVSTQSYPVQPNEERACLTILALPVR
jgi:uncharacterized lipoprotein YbaY